MNKTPENQNSSETLLTNQVARTAVQILSNLLLIRGVSEEKYELISGHLSDDQIEVLWEDILASEKMTTDKIMLVAFDMTVEEINLYTPKVIESSSDVELSRLCGLGQQVQNRDSNGKLSEITLWKMWPFSNDFLRNETKLQERQF